jgi:hypothetical protein
MHKKGRAISEPCLSEIITVVFRYFLNFLLTPATPIKLSKENRLDWVFYLQPPMNDGSMKNNWQHKLFRVHY